MRIMANNKTIKEISMELIKVRDNHTLHQQTVLLYQQDSRAGVKKLIKREINYFNKQRCQAERINQLLKEERQLQSEGYSYIAGVDEAGRGPLAGPVVAAAVMLPLHFRANHLLDDSKKVQETTREMLYEEIISQAIDVKVAFVTPAVIDKINILQAALLAMAMAVNKLDPKPQIALVDGNKKIPALNLTQRAIIKGDAKVRVIAAASIVAKVYRDRLMRHLNVPFHQYKFDLNKGYPTAEHRRLLERFGFTAVHRRTFNWRGNEQ